MNDDLCRYSTFTPLQQLGENLTARGADGPVRRSRWTLASASLFAGALFTVSPAGAVVREAIDDLVGSEPTASSLFLGDQPAGHQLSEWQQDYFEALVRLSQIVGEGTTPLGTPFQMVVQEEPSSPVFGSSAFVAFDTELTSSRGVSTGIGPTVSEGFDRADTPIYPTIYRGPIEEEDTPTPVIIGVAPAEVVSVGVSYLDSDGRRVEAPTTTAPVTTALLEAKDQEAGTGDSVHSDLRPRFSNEPYAFFVSFLPPSLDRAGPKARQVDIDFTEIEVTALGSDGQELYSMRMDGRFSGDPGVISFG